MPGTAAAVIAAASSRLLLPLWRCSTFRTLPAQAPKRGSTSRESRWHGARHAGARSMTIRFRCAAARRVRILTRVDQGRRRCRCAVPSGMIDWRSNAPGIALRRALLAENHPSEVCPAMSPCCRHAPMRGSTSRASRWRAARRAGACSMVSRFGCATARRRAPPPCHRTASHRASQGPLAFPDSTAASGPSSPNLASDLGHIGPHCFHSGWRFKALSRGAAAAPFSIL